MRAREFIAEQNDLSPEQAAPMQGFKGYPR